MKIVFKSAGKGEDTRKPMLWIALRDKTGKYFCHIDESHCSDNIILAGHIIYAHEKKRMIELLTKEGHYV